MMRAGEAIDHADPRDDWLRGPRCAAMRYVPQTWPVTVVKISARAIYDRLKVPSPLCVE
ncbi:MAG: hypothetical protein ACOC0P_00995 [Planctomycetota bacterium]